ncbi:uncharacterized protein M6B38_338550 [Iris pallida]|uniref:Uncharacterized protein n=1 Tax=Iris pallida TaxID=29817 RepID=A0AAX6GYX0_IRIPA|nr:uncharacterized protein M6B38_338550 [Iris pallida]
MCSAKLRHLLDFKLDKTIPAQGERSGLLNVEGEKNDYDWKGRMTAALEFLIHSNDEEFPTDACWDLSYLSVGTNDKIQVALILHFVEACIFDSTYCPLGPGAVHTQMDGCILDSKIRVVKCLEAAILRRVSETSLNLILHGLFSTFFLVSFSIAY